VNKCAFDGCQTHPVNMLSNKWILNTNYLTWLIWINLLTNSNSVNTVRNSFATLLYFTDTTASCTLSFYSQYWFKGGGDSEFRCLIFTIYLDGFDSLKFTSATSTNEWNKPHFISPRSPRHMEISRNVKKINNGWGRHVGDEFFRS